MSDFPAMEYQDPEAPDGETALGLLQSVYRDKRVPLHTRMKAAKECLPFETPKLGIVGYVHEAGTFAQALERAITRSREERVTLELTAEPDAGDGRVGVGKVADAGKGAAGSGKVPSKDSNGDAGKGRLGYSTVAGQVPSAWRPGR
jgi:hypothetical protein